MKVKAISEESKKSFGEEELEVIDFKYFLDQVMFRFRNHKHWWNPKDFISVKREKK